MGSEHVILNRLLQLHYVLVYLKSQFLVSPCPVTTEGHIIETEAQGLFFSFINTARKRFVARGVKAFVFQS